MVSAWLIAGGHHDKGRMVAVPACDALPFGVEPIIDRLALADPRPMPRTPPESKNPFRLPPQRPLGEDTMNENASC